MLYAKVTHGLLVLYMVTVTDYYMHKDKKYRNTHERMNGEDGIT